MAVEASMADRDGLWFGWSGPVAESPAAPVTVERGGIRYVLTDLPPNDFQEYYKGYANRVLWPVLRYRLDLAEFSPADFEG